MLVSKCCIALQMNIHRSCVVVLLLLGCIAALAQPAPASTISCHASGQSTTQTTNCARLGPNALLQWNATSDTITFNFTIAAPQLQWMGLGFSETGSMKGADMIIFQQQDGQWTASDRWSTNFTMPTVDQQQDVVLVSTNSMPTSNLMSVTFRRRLITCDTAQDLPIRPGQQLFIIHAWGSGPLSYHGPNRGTTPLILVPAPDAEQSAQAVRPSRLVSQDAPQVAAEADTRLVNISLDEVTIPANETTYLYQWFKMPSDRKYHVTSFRPLWGTSGDRYAHHAVVYGCSPSATAAIEALPSKRPTELPPREARCTQFYALVVPWMAKTDMPPEAGLPYGQGSYSYLMLEVHFNNPERIRGETDRGTGVTFEVTSRLRPNDMGLLTLAQSALQIPPGRENFSTPTSYCNAPCTQRIRQPINLVNQFFHMHGLGESAITRRYRNGAELAPLGELRTYDYRYQNYLPMPADAQALLPGDELAFTCTFNSMSRTNVTTFGPGTQDEMCFHWIYYWPLVPNWGVCASIPPIEDRPSLPVCDLEDTLLFAGLEPNISRQLIAQGLPYNVTIPSGTPYVAPACTPGLPDASAVSTPAASSGVLSVSSTVLVLVMGALATMLQQLLM